MHLLSDHNIATTLKELGVYVTQNRIVILKVLMHCSGAVSVANIRRLADTKLDRVSVYRTLQFLLEKGLLFVVPNASGIPHYAISSAIHRPDKQDVAFFICTKCGSSELLKDKIKVNHRSSANQSVNIKARYVVFEGLCNKCQS